ncbi:uncharacterized protein KRP23_10244 [Phytophthora ramorum]|uniref:uncharacterized protein n=1 Tax=Phytophthora ramorum TaxID=164328 RepID=UPI00309BC13A|nr:hypothetical protein KRP23_10244 [Phytophthora ramorum]
MRLPSALASVALLLHAAPAATQTSTTTDVNYPTVLSAAGNITGLPGGNEFCGSARVRKPWGALSADEQALYLEATELAVADGGVADFSAIAADALGQAQGEYSCGFFSWHRRLLLAYESYLRDLDERFACLTLPYYDVHTAYVQAVSGECTNMFECSGIFDAIGGAPNSTDEATLTFDGVQATGYAVSGAPYAESCDDDDNCGYIVRDDLSSKGVPSAASFGSFQGVVASSGDYASFLEGIQYGVHNEVLDAVGGAFSTAAAARDVLYYSWYSALDMYLHVYHLCRIGVPLTYDQVVESLEAYANATQTCGSVDGVDAESAIIMRITVDGEVVDASQHPTLGQYFGYVGSDNWNYADIQQLGDYSYTYQLPEVLRQQILSNNDMCTGFNRAFAASYTTLNAAAIKSTTTTKTTTKTTTTKTTKIVNGKKVTTTKVTKVITRANSTSASSAKSTVTSGQLVSKYGYTYLGNFSTDNVAYDRLQRSVHSFEGNLDLVATHMKLLECYTFDSVYGLSNYSTTFVTDKNLITNRVECGQRLDLVRSGLLQLAVRSTEYSAKSLKFASSTVIRTIRTSYKRVTTRKVTYIRKSYTQKVQNTLESTQEALGNITVTSTSGSGNDETSTTVVDTGYITSNTTSTTQQSAKNATAVTTTSSTTTTATTAANVSETLSEASSGSTSGSTELVVSGSNSETGSSEEGSSATTTGSNGETTTTTTTTGSGGSIKTTTTGSGGSVKTATTGSGATTTTVTTGSGASTTTTTTGGTTSSSTTTSGGSATTGTTTGSTTTSGDRRHQPRTLVPRPTRVRPLTGKSTPAPTTTETEKPTPAPTTAESKTPATEKPTPAPTTTETEKSTPAPTTTETKTRPPLRLKRRSLLLPDHEGFDPGSYYAMPGEDSGGNYAVYPAPTTAGPSTEAPTPCPTTAVPSTESPTPCPTTEVPATGAPTPCPTTDVPVTEAPTPCPTTDVPVTEAPTPYPTTDVPETEALRLPLTEAPTPYPTTVTPKTETPVKTVETKSGTKTSTTTSSSNNDDDYTFEQQQQTEQQTQQSASSSTKTFSTSYTASTTTSDAMSGAAGGMGAAAVGGIVAAVCAVVALAGFTAYKMRQRANEGDLSPSGYYSQPTTPVTRSIKL